MACTPGPSPARWCAVPAGALPDPDPFPPDPPIPVLSLLLLLSAAAPDSTSYILLNHGRPAGAMIVTQRGDTVIVRYHHVDRNRGPRSETRYVVKHGVAESGQTWSLPLYGPTPNPLPRPFDSFETVGDSVRWKVGDSARSAPRGTYYRLRSFTPYDQAMFARYLLTRPERSATVPPGGFTKVEIAADT